MKKIDAIRKANKAETIQEDFEIIVNGEALKMRLAMPDVFTILEDQKKAYALKLAECEAEGMGKYPLNESEWNKELDAIEDEEAKENIIKNKPATLAEQVANSLSRLYTVRTLIPKILRDPDKDNELICSSPSDQKELGDYLANNSEALKVFTEK